MYRTALLSIIVYLLFNLATLYASSDPTEEQMTTEVAKCHNDSATTGGKDKIYNNITEFETVIQSLKDYLHKKNGNETFTENKEYIAIVKTALSDKRYPNITKNQKCINKTELAICRGKHYAATEKISLMQKVFTTNHNMSQTRSSCSLYRKIKACILKNVVNLCDNTMISFIKEMTDTVEKKCAEIVEDSNIESASDDKDGAARCLQTILRSISMAFLAVILL